MYMKSIFKITDDISNTIDPIIKIIQYYINTWTFNIVIIKIVAYYRLHRTILIIKIKSTFTSVKSRI